MKSQETILLDDIEELKTVLGFDPQNGIIEEIFMAEPNLSFIDKALSIISNF